MMSELAFSIALLLLVGLTLTILLVVLNRIVWIAVDKFLSLLS